MQGEALDSPAATRRAWVAAVAMVVIFSAVIVTTHHCRDRSLVGAHGLLHTALVYSVLDHGVPPDNPFAAGASLPYYWGYHAAAAGVACGLEVNPLYAFEVLNLVALAAFVLAVTAVGRILLGSAGRGALAAMLALIAAHPFGPVVLGVRILNGDVDLSPLVAPDQHLHPFRLSLYAGDVRFCTILAWFMNPSGRGPGLGLAAIVLWLGVRAEAARRGVWGWWSALVLVVAALTAIAPLLAGALVAAGFGIGLVRPSRRAVSMRLVLAGIAGVALAAPTWIGMLAAVGDGPPLFAPETVPGALAQVALTGGPLAVLALVGVWRVGGWRVGRRRTVRSSEAASPGGSDLTGLLVGGLLMFAFAVLVRLPERNEHNVFHLGMVFLALPAAAACGRLRRAPALPLILVLAAAFLPAPLLHISAAWVRTPSGLAFPAECIVGAGGPERLAVHTWLRTETPADTVIIDVAWPEDGPPPTAQNVSSLPAETRRALWLDRPSYLIPRTAEVAQRAQATYRLFRGIKLTAEDRRELASATGSLRILCRGASGRARVERALGHPLRVVYDDGTHLVLAMAKGDTRCWKQP